MKTKIATFFIFTLFFMTACSGNQPPHASAGGADAELKACLQFSAKKKYKEAIDCLEVYKSRYPGSRGSEDAEITIADNYFRQKDYLIAAESYQGFIKKSPYHPRLDYAYFKSGLAYLKASPKAIDRDQQYLETAAQNLEAVVKYFPSSNYKQLAEKEYTNTRKRLARREFYIGRFYYRYREYLSAVPRFQGLLMNYPGLGYDEKSFYYLIVSLVRTNQKELAREVVASFEQAYPSSDLLKKARARI